MYKTRTHINLMNLLVTLQVKSISLRTFTHAVHNFIAAMTTTSSFIIHPTIIYHMYIQSLKLTPYYSYHITFVIPKGQSNKCTV